MDTPPAHSMFQPPRRLGRYISLAVLLVLLIALGVMFYRLMAPFLLPLFLAAVTAIVAEPLLQRIMTRLAVRRSVAAGITSVVLVFALLVPTIVVVVLAATQLAGFVQDKVPRDRQAQQAAWEKLVKPVFEQVATVVPNSSAEQLQQDIETSLRGLAARISENTLSMARTTVGALVAIVVAASVFLVALYFFLADGPAFVAELQELIPLDPEQQRRMTRQFTMATRAVVTATLSAAVVQGVMTATAMQVLGFRHFLVFLVVTTIAALIPLVGAWLVWLPFVFVLGSEGHWVAATGLAIYGWFGISLADNIVRMYVLNTDAQLHPLLGLVSVLGALDVMGLWGIFIGPIVASCFTAALRILNQELRSLIQERRNSAVPTVIVPPPTV